jgi:hypothetical protein
VSLNTLQQKDRGVFGKDYMLDLIVDGRGAVWGRR